MPFFRVEKRSGTYAPAVATTDEAGTILASLSKDARIIAFTARVVVAANGTTATLSFGRTGAATVYMAAADVAVRTAGLKTTSTGADLAGNGTVGNGAGADTNIIVAWTHGDATTGPVIAWTALIVREETWKKQIAR